MSNEILVIVTASGTGRLDVVRSVGSGAVEVEFEFLHQSCRVRIGAKSGMAGRFTQSAVWDVNNFGNSSSCNGKRITESI